MWDQEPFHRGIAAVDIKAFAGPQRSNRNRLEARDALKTMMIGSLGAADIDPRQYGLDVRGMTGWLVLKQVNSFQDAAAPS